MNFKNNIINNQLNLGFISLSIFTILNYLNNFKFFYINPLKSKSIIEIQSKIGIRNIIQNSDDLIIKYLNLNIINLSKKEVLCGK